jgi:hypothetical protein
MRSKLSSLILLFSVFCFAQNSLHFDGSNDALNCGTASALNVGGKSFSLEAWIYADNWRTNVFEGSIVLKENNSNNGGFMFRAGNGGIVNFAIGAGSSGAWTELNTAAILSTSTWYHLAATYDGSKMRIYVDGVIKDSLSASINVGGTATTPLTIGYQPTYTGRNWSGRIDEVRIWSKVLTASEILANKDKEFCSLSVSDLAGYYKLDEGVAQGNNSGITTAIDYSGNGNSDTLTNFALSSSSSNWLTGANLNQDTVTTNDSSIHCGAFFDVGTSTYYTTTSVISNHVPSYTGCDSFFTRKFIINQNTFTTINAEVCDSFISPTGIIYDSSGTYYDAMPNSQGCDSVFTIILKVGADSSFIDTAVCYGFTSFSGMVYTQSGTYYETFSSSIGCDSIEKINVLVFPRTYASLNLKTCDSVLNPSKTKWLTPGQAYSDTLANQYRCDSIINITVSSLNSDFSDTVHSCVSYISPSGSLYTSSGDYIDSVKNHLGCDSTIRTHLTILRPSAESMVVSGCYSAQLPNSDSWVTVSGAYYDTLQNVAGCDSIVTMDVTINTVNIEVKKEQYTLTALSPTGTFQWLNCVGKSPINGEINAIFKHKNSGSYEVEVTEGNCIDTSECSYMTGLGIDEIDAFYLKIVPNPASSSFVISCENLRGNATIRIKSFNGETVWQEQSNGEKNQTLRPNLAAGIYFVEVQNSEIHLIKRLVIQ